MNRMLMIVSDEMQRRRFQQFFQVHFDTHAEADSLTGIVKAVQSNPDIVLLHCEASKITVYDLCEQLRQHTQAVIVVISDGWPQENRIACFESGADDVVDRAVGDKELLYKMNALLRRSVQQQSIEDERNSIHLGPLVMNKMTHRAYIDQQELMLTRKEFSIIWMLVSKQNQIVSRNELLRIVWSYDHLGDDRMIDTHLNRIRKKLSSYNQSIVIKTVWGIGYKIEWVFSPAQKAHTN